MDRFPLPFPGFLRRDPRGNDVQLQSGEEVLIKPASPGITALDMAIAVLVFGLSCSFGVPAYSEFQARADRAEARAALLSAATWLEVQKDRSALELPASLRVVPNNGMVRYRLRVETPAAGHSRIVADPVGMRGDRCGSLSIDASGLRGASGAESPEQLDSCWSR